jgi:hypothetical protein
MIVTLLAALTTATALPPTYELHFSKSDPRAVQVTAEFTVVDTLLAMVPYGAEHLPDGWRTFVKNERLTVNGAAARLERLPERRWRIWAPVGSRARLEYAVAVEHDLKPWTPNAREAAYARSWGTFAVGRALFVYHDAKDTTIAVRVLAPDGWSAHSVWEKKGAGNYTVRGWSDVINSVLFVGDARAFAVRQGPVGVNYVLGGASFASSEPLLFDVHGTPMVFDLRRDGAKFSGKWSIAKEKSGTITGTWRSVHN